MFSDVARSERAKNGVGDGVGKNIGIGMSFEPARDAEFRRRRELISVR